MAWLDFRFARNSYIEYHWFGHLSDCIADGDWEKKRSKTQNPPFVGRYPDIEKAIGVCHRTHDYPLFIFFAVFFLFQFCYCYVFAVFLFLFCFLCISFSFWSDSVLLCFPYVLVYLCRIFISISGWKTIQSEKKRFIITANKSCKVSAIKRKWSKPNQFK